MQKQYITTRVPDTMKRDIERIAKLERRTVSNVAEMLLEEALKQRKNGRGGQTSQASANPPAGR